MENLLNNIINHTQQAATQAVIQSAVSPEAFDVDSAYAGLVQAENGGQVNPFIRTKDNSNPKGSTAFGPAGITYELAKGAVKNGYLSPESISFYMDVMQPKWEMMKKIGINQSMKAKGITAKDIKDYNPDYDYGGGAEFDVNKHGQAYMKFAKDIMLGVANKEAKGNEAHFLDKWRGATMNSVPKYYQRYLQGKESFKKSKKK